MKNIIILLLTVFMLFGLSGSVMGQTLYSEDFTGQNGKGIYGGTNGITIDTSGVDWTIEVGGTLETDSDENYFWVDNEKFVGLDVDGNAYWYTPSIDVSGIDGVDLSIDLEVISGGANSSGENLSIYYTTNPSAETPIYTLLDEYDENSMGSVPTTYSKLNIDASSATEFQIRIGVNANGAGDGFSFDNISLSENTVKNEPVDHVSEFEATGTIGAVDLSWIDVSSSPNPDGYLIKANNTGLEEIIDPTDTNTESDDTDLSDGSARLNVLQGTEEASFSGLNETTTYYFKIYPYTNSGSDIDYKTDGTVPEAQATTLETPDIVLNEFLADPPPDTDVNGDGTNSTSDDEFIEFVNTGTSNLDLSNWTIDEGAGLAHTFPASTILKPMQAIVIFSGGSTVGDFGGSLTQISTEGYALNNGGDEIILKNASGVEIINYSYGSEGGNDESVTRNDDLTGGFTGHGAANTDDGSLFSPGTRIDGSTFQPSVKITGSEGWRMLSSPTSGTTLQTLLKDHEIFTQCFTGADITGGVCDSDPNVTENVYFYDTSTNAWSAATNITNTVDAGTGVLVYVYEDDDPTEAGITGGFPKTISVFGAENTETTPAINSTNDGLTFLGNPFASPIDWSQVTHSNLTGTIYVWDANSSSWKTNAGETGEHSGVLPAFQGFFVENSESASGSVTFTDAAKTTGGTFYGKEAPKQIVRLELSGEGMSNSSWLRFSEAGALEKTRGDALQLEPLSANYAVLASRKADGNLMDISHLPVPNGEFELPVKVEATKSGTYKLTATDFSLPAEMELYFYDRQEDESVRLDENFRYEFELQTAAKVNPDPFARIKNGLQSMKAKSTDTRFVITSNVSVSNEPISSPKHFTLEQNYPNPFNPSTSIQYSVAKAGEVELAVYNVMGQRVETLVSGTKSAGSYRVSWNAANMASGIYYYRLQAGNEVLTRQMTLIK